MPAPKNTGGKRDLDGDGDIDLMDDPSRDLDRDGKIEIDDREEHDIDADNDIDATDRTLAAKQSVGVALGLAKVGKESQSQEQKQSQSAGLKTR